MARTVEVLVGTLGRPHGLRGELAVHVRTDEPERRLAPGASVLLDGTRERVVASARWHSGVLLLGLVGVTDRTAAEALRGLDLWARVPADEVPADDDAYYDRQLVGLEVRDAAGAAVGTVTSVLHLPAQDVLAVRTSGGERLVPFVTELVPVVDLAGGYLQVADVGGLLSDVDDQPGASTSPGGQGSAPGQEG